MVINEFLPFLKGATLKFKVIVQAELKLTTISQSSLLTPTQQKFSCQLAITEQDLMRERVIK